MFEETYETLLLIAFFNNYKHLVIQGGRNGRVRIVVGFTTTCVRIPLMATCTRYNIM